RLTLAAFFFRFHALHIPEPRSREHRTVDACDVDAICGCCSAHATQRSTSLEEAEDERSNRTWRRRPPPHRSAAYLASASRAAARPSSRLRRGGRVARTVPKR